MQTDNNVYSHTHRYTTRRWLWKLVWVVVSVIKRRRWRRRRTNASRTWASISEGRTAAQREREKEREELNEDITGHARADIHTRKQCTRNSIEMLRAWINNLLPVYSWNSCKKTTRTQVNCLECSLQRLLSLVSAGNAAYAWYSLARF